MTASDSKARRSWTKGGGALLALGAVGCIVGCTAGPLLAAIGLASAGAALAIPGAELIGAGLFVAAGVAFMLWRRRRMQGAACNVDGSCRSRASKLTAP